MGKRGRPASPGLLTPREQEVLGLLRASLTNADIGERLGISVETVKQHVSEILSKLGVATREEAAAWQPQEERRWSVGRILLASAGTTVVAAVVAGLALLAWGLSRAADSEVAAEVTPIGVPTDTRAATATRMPQATPIPLSSPPPYATCEQWLEQEPQKRAGGQIAITSIGDDICWVPVVGARYMLDITTTFYATCEAWYAGAKFSVHIGGSPFPPEGTSSWHLSQTLDPKYQHVKDVSVTIRAVGAPASGPQSGAFAVQREIDFPGLCGTPPPATPTPTPNNGPVF